MELADTLGLEPSAARHGGSTPSLGTIFVSSKGVFLGLSEDLFRKTIKLSSNEFNPTVKTIIADILKVTKDVKVYVFGSVARNEATNNSDLDILFVFSNLENISEIQKQFYRTKTLLQTEVDIVFKTEESLKNTDSIFFDTVKDELKEVYPTWTLN